MRGLLADANVEGHQARVGDLLRRLGLQSVLAELELELATLADVGLSPDMDDRALWQYCQQEGWVLFTDNRNDDGETSLQATLTAFWTPGDLPVFTLADKKKFEQSADYRERVARDVAELLFGIFENEFRDRGRIYIPR